MARNAVDEVPVKYKGNQGTEGDIRNIKELFGYGAQLRDGHDPKPGLWVAMHLATRPVHMYRLKEFHNSAKDSDRYEIESCAALTAIALATSG